MSKIKFTLGKIHNIVFNLPSRAPGNSSICMGKVIINVPGLNCSKEIEFDQFDLVKLSLDSKKLHETVKGRASISSKCRGFKLVISGTNKGHIKFEVTLNNYYFTSPENLEWSSSITFYEYLESLQQVIGSIKQIQS